jgi:hypothetical protein
MFCAAMQAAAFVESDPAKLVAIGLSEIPAECRLAQAVRTCLTWIAASPDWESCMDKIDAAFADMSAVHTINNALICVMSLFYGKMDTVQATAISVMGALDTDCTGATVGSIVGAAAGKARFRAASSNPSFSRLNRVRSSAFRQSPSPAASRARTENCRSPRTGQTVIWP